MKKLIFGFGLLIFVTSFSVALAQEVIEDLPATEEVAVEEILTFETIPFTDVEPGHPEYVALQYLKAKGIIKGYDDGSFKPSNLINRVEALKIILEANKVVSQSYLDNNSLGGASYEEDLDKVDFSDIEKEQWYIVYLKKAVQKNIVKGYEDGTFKPLQAVNRAESFKMVMESDGLLLGEPTEEPFNDVHISDWFAKYFHEGKLRQIVYFSMGNNANPGTELTRSRFSELIYRYLKSKEGIMFGKGSYYADFFEGRGTASGVPYRAAELTAAHLKLPFGTIVKVTNLENGNSVIVEINDRGPYITGRIIDLSRTAFETIAHPGKGIIYVQYEILNEVE